MKPPRAGRGIFPAAAKLVATGCIGISFGSRSVAFAASIPSAPQSYLNVNETGSLAHDATTTSVVLASSLTKEVSLMASRSVAFGAVPPVGVTVAIATGAVYAIAAAARSFVSQKPCITARWISNVFHSDQIARGSKGHGSALVPPTGSSSAHCQRFALPNNMPRKCCGVIPA